MNNLQLLYKTVVLCDNDKYNKQTITAFYNGNPDTKFTNDVYPFL